MRTKVSPEIKELVEVTHYRPAVSIIVPFEPKMIAENELKHSLKLVSDKTARELQQNYPAEIVQVIMDKLHNSINSLNYNSHKKSIAIFISPVFQKVLYLEIPVEEKVIVDESFEIRDLLYCKKELHKYLVLLLSGKGSKIFLGDTDSFVRIVSNGPESVYAFENDLPERVANFSDPSERKETVMEKFVYHVDKMLDIILQAYHLPLFVMGTERVAGHFKAITKHQTAIMDYVHGNYDDVSVEKIKEVLAPYIADWKQVKQHELLNSIREAQGQNKLSIGISEVWKSAIHRRGRLLVVEKNYMFAAEHGATQDEIGRLTNDALFSGIKDAVDDVIEKVLANGGDVEFVDEGFLLAYQHIVLIHYY